MIDDIEARPSGNASEVVPLGITSESVTIITRGMMSITADAGKIELSQYDYDRPCMDFILTISMVLKSQSWAGMRNNVQTCAVGRVSANSSYSSI